MQTIALADLTDWVWSKAAIALRRKFQDIRATLSMVNQGQGE